MMHKKVLHHKVRTGCVECKRRRVKCDEARPACKNCVWRSVDCLYEPPGHRSSPPGKNSSQGAAPYSFVDFKLFHNWAVATGDSLAPNQSLQRAMREVVPLLAMNHEFLMHAMLSLSSLHMAHLHPHKVDEYELLAAQHQDLALPLFRTALACVSETNCHALYACGHLVTKYAFASPRARQTLVFSSGRGSVPDLMSLLRGSFSIHDYAFEWLFNGPLGFCLEKPLDDSPDFEQNPDDHHLARLLALLIVTDDEVDDENKKQDTNVCCGALNCLRSLLAMAAVPGQTISTKTLAYSWPFQVPARFITLIGDRKPEALLVLAHYCVMLKMIDSFWFMKGCAAGILEQCRQSLDERWHQYIEWPVQVVNQASIDG